MPLANMPSIRSRLFKGTSNSVGCRIVEYNYFTVYCLPPRANTWVYCLPPRANTWVYCLPPRANTWVYCLPPRANTWVYCLPPRANTWVYCLPPRANTWVYCLPPRANTWCVLSTIININRPDCATCSQTVHVPKYSVSEIVDS